MKFGKNFDISKSHENWYTEVLKHAVHESGISFLITLISNLTSPILTNENKGSKHYLTLWMVE